MEKQIRIAVLFFWVMMCSIISKAQFIPLGGAGSVYLQPTYPGFGSADQLSVGIGDFTTAMLYPNSFFHINSNLIPNLPSNGSITSFGEIFWSDCPDDAATYWRMLRGGTHYGWLWNNSRDENANDFSIGSPSGSLLFHTLDGTYADVSSTMIPHFRISNSNPVGSGTPTYLTTASMERLEVTPDVLGSATALGFGAILQNPRLLVVGGNSSGLTEPVAEFRSIAENSSSIGIKIRGARHGATKADCAYIDFANLDDGNDMNTTNDVEYKTSRISSDQREYTNHRGYMRFYTTDDITGGTISTLHSKLMIDYNGYTGIGYDLFDASTPPDKRLEIYDAGDVQLRLSQTHGSAYSDFQTTSSGNLRINPTGTKTGFNLEAGTNPANTVEIDAAGTYNLAAPLSGLRLTDMRSGSTPTVTNNKVLSVNGNGDVILVPDNDGGSSIVCVGQTANYLNKWNGSKVCASMVYEETNPPYKVGIGTTYLTGQAAQLAVENTATTASNIVNIYGKVNGANQAPNTYGLNMDVSDGTTNTYGIYTTAKSDDGDVTGIYAKVNPPGNGNSGQILTGADIIASQASATNIGTVNGVKISTRADNANSTINGIDCSNYSNNTNDGIVSIGGKFKVENYNDNAYSYGIKTHVSTNYTDATENYGGYFESYATHMTTGTSGINIKNIHAVHGYALGDYSVEYEVAGGYFMGQSLASDNSDVFGVIAISDAAGSPHISYGVFASGGSTCTSTPSISNCPFAAGFFSGDVGVTGLVFDASDQILKDNVQPIADASSILSQLFPKSYTFKTQSYPSMHLSEGTHFGLIAEDVKPILPDLVRGFTHPAERDSVGKIVYPAVDYQGLNYTGLIPLLIAGFNEQKQKIDSLISALQGVPKQSNPNQPNTNGNNTNQLKVTLSNSKVVYLSQNIPNPFEDNTTITFNIQTDVKTAQIIFTENNGVVLKSMEIEQRGESTLTVFGENLSKGIYNYSLIIDGSVFETKRMVRQ